MNKSRRNEILKIIGGLEHLKKINEIDSLNKIEKALKSVLFDEEMAFDNMPESFHDCARGFESQEAIEAMEEALESLKEAKCVENDEEFYEIIETAIFRLEEI